MGVSKEAALDLKRTALAKAEAEQHLRSAGDTTEGVVEAAAEDVLDKTAAYEDAYSRAKGEHTPEPGDAPHASEARDVAAAEEDVPEPKQPESETEMQGHEASEESDVTGSKEDKAAAGKSGSTKKEKDEGKS